MAGEGSYSEPLEKINNDRNFTKYLNATGITTAACSIVGLSQCRSIAGQIRRGPFRFGVEREHSVCVCIFLG